MARLGMDGYKIIDLETGAGRFDGWTGRFREEVDEFTYISAGCINFARGRGRPFRG